ncbi:MAG: hypothetical protein PVG54_20260, partial [Anaerolineae bacterium]
MRSGLLLLLTMLLVVTGCSFPGALQPTRNTPDAVSIVEGAPTLAEDTVTPAEDTTATAEAAGGAAEDATGPVEETMAAAEGATGSVDGVDSGASSEPVPSPQPTEVGATPAVEADPLALISQESLLGYIGDLAAIQPYSGWRNSAT